MKTVLVAIAAVAGFSTLPANATSYDPAPGASSILNADYATAEREIRSADVVKYDPARMINLGIVLAKTGRPDDAAKQFRRVMMQDDVTIVVANGVSASSHDVASQALAMLNHGQLSH